MPLTTIKNTGISGNTIVNTIVESNGIELVSNSSGIAILTLTIPHPFMLMGV